MDASTFLDVVALLGEQGDEDIAWCEGIRPPATAEEFALEHAFVVCNSGMQNRIAAAIFAKVKSALLSGASPHQALGHRGKAHAIENVWNHRESYFASFKAARDKVEACGALPYIGPTTKWHLAKNFGTDCVKPDVHITRLAKAFDTTPEGLCRPLAQATGWRLATVDTLLWRACANGIVDSHTGEVRK